MLSALLGSSAAGKTRDRASAVQFSSGYALDVMKRDIQHAGDLGITGLFAPDEPVTIAVANVCNLAVVGQISRRACRRRSSSA